MIDSVGFLSAPINRHLLRSWKACWEEKKDVRFKDTETERATGGEDRGVSKRLTSASKPCIRTVLVIYNVIFFAGFRRSVSLDIPLKVNKCRHFPLLQVALHNQYFSQENKYGKKGEHTLPSFFFFCVGACILTTMQYRFFQIRCCNAGCFCVRECIEQPDYDSNHQAGGQPVSQSMTITFGYGVEVDFRYIEK